MVVFSVVRCLFFFFKQKTAYEMRISDWSSDVCSSDLWDRAAELRELNKLTGAILGPFESWLTLRGIKTLSLRVPKQSENAATIAGWLSTNAKIGRASCRERVCQYV